MQLNDASLDKVMNFETYLDEQFKHLKFVAIIDPLTVVQLGFDAPAKHRHYVAALPPGIPNDWRAYKYAKFLDPVNNPVYLGIPWVRQSSITEDDNAPYVIRVWGATPDAIQSLRSMMVANGIEKFEISRN